MRETCTRAASLSQYLEVISFKIKTQSQHYTFSITIPSFAPRIPYTPYRPSTIFHDQPSRCKSVQNKVNLLNKLPPPSQRAPDLSSGCIRLHQDFNRNSNNTEIDIYRGSYPEKERHRFEQRLFDSASWVAFNLPVGTVLTFMDNLPSRPDSGEYADLSDAGRTVNLIGTGRTEGVDLDQLQMNDKISQFFWRKVDLNRGAIEIFDDQDFKNNHVTIFLSEATSLRWLTLECEPVKLYDNWDGKGGSFNRVAGGNDTRQINKLQDSGFNDRISAFRWASVKPVDEVIQPITISETDQQDESYIRESTIVTNPNDRTQTITANFTKKHNSNHNIHNGHIRHRCHSRILRIGRSKYWRCKSHVRIEVRSQV
ncbi:hypothetical protein G6011_11411 [Alternaria panax]|uniref:Uncharacterized protein n=1 Tax=Alternaria panax TaxID=48097 RepID=A0AAD4IDN9_9PLEO|nr:hypothetical protein G6011_11411 [Alternaria panax]